MHPESKIMGKGNSPFHDGISIIGIKRLWWLSCLADSSYDVVR
jgi:hypothetical protein